MITPEQIKAILGRIAEGKETKEDIQRLKQAISSGKEMEIQLGETIVNIGEGQGIHIGNKVIHQFDVEAIRELLKKKNSSSPIIGSLILVVMGLLLGIFSYRYWPIPTPTEEGGLTVNQQPDPESVAKNTVYSIIKAQEDFFVTQNTFTTNVNDLNLFLDLKTEDYKYEVRNFRNVATNVAVVAIPKHNNLRSFAGVVANLGYLKNQSQVLGDKSNMKSIICQTVQPSLTPPNLYVMGQYLGHQRTLTCPDESEEVTASN